MKGEKLYKSMEHVDDQLLERSEKRKGARPWWIGAVAAALAVAVALGVLLRPGMSMPVQAIETAVYPEMAPYPLEEDYYDETTGEFDNNGYNAAHDAWWESQRALAQEAGYADGLDGFFAQSIPVFLSGKEGENAVYSPVNVYLALAMLAEVTGGSSRQQILDLLGSGTIEESRDLAKAVWQGQYQDDGTTASILASSLWLRDDLSYKEDTMKILAEEYYASSFQGEMGSDAYNQQLRDWLNEQTRGLLEEQAEGIELNPLTALALATTLYFKAAWYDEFSPENTSPQTFHGPEGDLETDFMHQTFTSGYYRGENFGIVRKGLQHSGDMWMILPDEGTTPEELLEQGAAVETLLAEYNWEDWESRLVHLSLPKFDAASETDLLGGLQTLGVTDVMDERAADLTPMTDVSAYLSTAQHAARVTVDEEGVEAAAFTVMAADTSAEPEEPEELVFVLDRPFLFAVTSSDGLPLFVGVVNQP